MSYAMMVLAFKAYLQIGEMVPLSRGTIRGCLHLDVLLSGELIIISFRRFKHSARQSPQSDAQIRAEGRWTSDAFKKYIRIA